MIFSRKHILRGVSIACLMLFLGAALLVWKSGFFGSPTAEEKSLLSQGMALHAALWIYESDHGRLPDQLSELVPKYLKQAELDAPNPLSGGPMFRLVDPKRPTSERRMNADLLVSVPVRSAGREGARMVHVQEDGDVFLRAAPN